MLIVEDGTGNPEANSYVSFAEFGAFLSARNIPVPSETDSEAALISATDYLEAKVCYKGRRATEDQGLSWPRRDVYLDNRRYPNNAIPRQLKTAQIRLAIESANGVDLMPTISGKSEDYVVREKVGPIETEFADPSKFDGMPSFTAVDALLAPLLGDACSNPYSFGVYRG